MKETRYRLAMPPEPQADPKEILVWIKRLNVILPQYLDTLQRTIMEAQPQTYDIYVPVPDDENLENVEFTDAMGGSAGCLTAPTVTEVNATTINVGVCTIQLRAADSTTSALIQFDMAAANVTVTADQNNFVGVEYNSGSPQFVSRATNNYNRNSEFLIAVVYPEST